MTPDNRPAPRPDETFELTLEAIANGGAAMGWRGKQAVFAPYTIPGERILARLVEDRGRFAWAEGLQLLDASTDRVFPACPHFGPGRCGRCQWQHIDYPAQLLLKQDVLADQLSRIARLDDAEVRAVIPSPDVWGYNYHMTLFPAGEGKLGFPGTDERIFPIEECFIVHPDLLALYHQLELDFEGLLRVRLQIGTDGAHMLVLSMKDDLAPELETDLPTSVNLLLSDNEPLNLIGESHTRYTIGGHTFRVTAGSAFRPNVSQLETLAGIVLDMLDLRGGESVLDLYAGVGFFSAFVAPIAGLVTLAESYPPAVTDADENLAEFENVDVFEGGVDDVLASLESDYDAAIVDPPSSGLQDSTAELLAESGIRRLIYVSGDAASLAHDCQRLARFGFRLAYVQPLDLAPQTFYVDSVALFTR
jgi:tRNA/tmRNA/rRNA uracil-C5-methylase (TrmA/RlmC/RlmD family)